ncbi:hypothetical protein [Streptomyces sp. NPDC029721]|uniref:hypothetical protein n=1 Tax=Streptomyces sp. NPDC029721 TaxID=3157090 RepID=UPI0033F97267
MRRVPSLSHHRVLPSKAATGPSLQPVRQHRHHQALVPAALIHLRSRHHDTVSVAWQ